MGRRGGQQSTPGHGKCRGGFLLDMTEDSGVVTPLPASDLTRHRPGHKVEGKQGVRAHLRREVISVQCRSRRGIESGESLQVPARG